MDKFEPLTAYMCTVRPIWHNRRNSHFYQRALSPQKAYFLNQPIRQAHVVDDTFAQSGQQSDSCHLEENLVVACHEPEQVQMCLLERARLWQRAPPARRPTVSHQLCSHDCTTLALADMLGSSLSCINRAPPRYGLRLLTV